MNNAVTSQPLTRRERRLMEEQQAQVPPATPENPGPVAAHPAKAFEQSTPAVGSLPQAPPAPAPPTPPAPPVPPVADLSRRERRALVHGEEGVASGLAPTRRERRALEHGEEGVASGLAPTPAPAVVWPQVPEAPSPREPTQPLFVQPREPQNPSDQAPLPPVFAFPVVVSSSPVPVGEDLLAPIPTRTVGDALLTTTSLILPISPQVDLSGPLGATGEILVTGQITVPTHFVISGTRPAFREDTDEDDSMDAYATGDSAGISQPMRAVHAVSGKGDNSDILMVRKTRWGTMAVVTALGASVLGVAAVALLILAMMTDVLA